MIKLILKRKTHSLRLPGIDHASLQLPHPLLVSGTEYGFQVCAVKRDMIRRCSFHGGVFNKKSSQRREREGAQKEDDEKKKIALLIVSCSHFFHLSCTHCPPPESKNKIHGRRERIVASVRVFALFPPRPSV